MTTPPPPAIQLPAPRLSAPMALPESFTVLVVDDQRSVRAALKAELQHAGVADIMEAGTAEEALAQFKARRPDLVLLDIKLPGRDGYWAAQQMREAEPGDWTPIIFLSGLDSDLDLWRGIESGGDDYLVKPYAFAELIARVEALARRRETGGVQTVLKVGDLEMNLIGRTVHRGTTEIDLQPREFQLLEFLMRHAGQSVTRTMLLENVWDYHFDPQTNVIDVHVSRLRSKIEKDFDQPLLRTVRGAGYMMKDEAAG